LPNGSVIIARMRTYWFNRNVWYVIKHNQAVHIK
jgi:hypothetical protein